MLRTGVAARGSGVAVALVAFVLGPAAEPAAGAEATVTADSAPLYARMSTSSPVIAVLNKDDRVVLGYALTEGGRRWCSVALVGAPRRSGYVPCTAISYPPSSAGWQERSRGASRSASPEAGSGPRGGGSPAGADTRDILTVPPRLVGDRPAYWK